MNTDALRGDFQAEALEHLCSMEAELLKLERTPSDTEPIRRMFVSAHTIKGGAALLELQEIREIAHALEDVLSWLRDGRRPLVAEIADQFFHTVDLLRSLVGAADGHVGTPETHQSTKDVIGNLRAIVNAAPKEATQIGRASCRERV